MPFEVQKSVQIPEGTLLRAKLKEIDVVTIPYTDKKTGEAKEFTKINWLFEVTQDGEYFGMDVRGETSAFLSNHPENKFRNWAEGLTGRPLDLGQVLDEQQLVGLQALITVKYEADRRDPDGRKFRRVEDVISVGGVSGNGGAPAYDEPPF